MKATLALLVIVCEELTMELQRAGLGPLRQYAWLSPDVVER